MAVNAQRRSVWRALGADWLDVGAERIVYVLSPGQVLAPLWHIGNPAAARAGDHAAPGSPTMMALA
jgi:hypothetical protein